MSSTTNAAFPIPQATASAGNTGTNSKQSASSTGKQSASSTGKQPPVILCVGLRLTASVYTRKQTPYVINLDPAVGKLPFACNIDIQDAVNYKQVMSQYQLGPNGAIITSLNLFTTKFDQVLDLVTKRAPELDYVLVDTPGQIEIFTWSASGQIITDTLASLLPTVLAYVIDTPRSTSPATFVSNMMYALSILYKTKLPMILVFNKCDVVDAAFARDWMTDFEAFQDAVRADEDAGFMGSLVGSMGMVLEEFYNALKVVSVSAVTGAGMDDFFSAVDEAVAEYYVDYKPAMDKKMADKKEALQKSRQENLTKLMLDMAVDNENGGKEVKMSSTAINVGKTAESNFYDDDGANEDEEIFSVTLEDRSTPSRAADESFNRFLGKATSSQK
ncbi:hypothetical protein HK100_004277 [Physocladia obscura]|uniref:GPN-loop GTPase n=1 Tax=Physocladia obscura TaxID=109957 RepID=A0AAD5XDY3_9FUNG|nr:hypothetical protein HK100_004277 [Physocladia obscura]